MRVATGQSDDADGGVIHGAVLRRYAIAILDPREDLIGARKAAIDTLGAEATAQAASIVASFDGINRVADATGIRLDPEVEARGSDSIIKALEVESLGAARV